MAKKVELIYYCYTHRTYQVKAKEGSKLDCPKCGDSLYFVPKSAEQKVPNFGKQTKTNKRKSRHGTFAILPCHFDIVSVK